MAIPVATKASHAAVDAGTSLWAVAALAAVVALVSAVFLHNGSGRARDGLLFGLFLAFTLTAIYAVADALDTWEGWVMLAVGGPIVTAKWLRARHRKPSRGSVPASS